MFAFVLALTLSDTTTDRRTDEWQRMKSFGLCAEAELTASTTRQENDQSSCLRSGCAAQYIRDVDWSPSLGSCSRRCRRHDDCIYSGSLEKPAPIQNHY